MRVSLKLNRTCRVCQRPAVYECDTTINSDSLRLQTCGEMMCKAHIASNPSDNYHRCLLCSRKRGDEGVFIEDKPEIVLPLVEEGDPF